MAIVGFALTPVTFGGSLGLAIPGIGLAVAGGATAAGASIVDIVIEKLNLKETQENLERDYGSLEVVRGIAERISVVIENVRERCPGVSAQDFVFVVGEVFVQGITRIGNLGIKLAEFIAIGTLEIGALALRVGGAAAKGIAGAAIGLNIVLIPIDLIEIVRSGYSLGRESQTATVRRLLEVADQLDAQKQSIVQQATNYNPMENQENRES